MRSTTIGVRLSAAEVELLDDLARTEGVSRSELVRFLLRLAASGYGFLKLPLGEPDAEKRRLRSRQWSRQC